jgi:hypothetical protein
MLANNKILGQPCNFYARGKGADVVADGEILGLRRVDLAQGDTVIKC